MGGCLGFITFVIFIIIIASSIPELHSNWGVFLAIASGFSVWYLVDYKEIRSSSNASSTFGGCLGFVVFLTILTFLITFNWHGLIAFIIAVIGAGITMTIVAAPAEQHQLEKDRRYEQSVRNFQEGEEERIAEAFVSHLEHLYGSDGGWKPIFKEGNVYNEDNPEQVLFRCQQVIIASFRPGSKRNKYWRKNLLNFSETEYKGNRDRYWLDKDGDEWHEVDMNPDYFLLSCKINNSDKNIKLLSVPGGWSLPKIGYLPGNQVFSTPYQVKLAALYDRG